MRTRTPLALLIASVTTSIALALPATPAYAGATYNTDATGDQSSGGGAPTSMKREADIRKAATWVKSGRAYVRIWLGDVSSRDTAVQWQGDLNRVHFVLYARRGSVKPGLVVSSKSRCTARVREAWNATANTATLSVPLSCLPSGRVVRDGRVYSTAAYRPKIPRAWASDELRLTDKRIR